MLGREPILSRAGGPLVDAHGRRSYVTLAGSGPFVVGTQLLVEYLGEQYPVTVAVASATPLYDPENVRIRA